MIQASTRTEKVERVDCNGRPYTQIVEKPYQAADPDCGHLGIVEVRRNNTGGIVAEGDVILFPDGSVRDKLSGSCHQPPPLGGEHPRLRFLLIERYWQAVYERLCFEFDRLKQRLSQRGYSFKVQVGNEQTDAVQRLKDLSKELVKVGKEKSKALHDLQEATPKTRRVSDEDILADQVRQSKFYEQVQEINRPEEE